MISTVFTLRNTLFGAVTWAVPFLAAFAFYDRTGQLAIDVFFFKSIMIVVGGLVGAWLLIRAFRRLTPGFVSGLMLGFYWFAINCALDLAVLVAAMGMPVGQWLTGIGLRYLMIPIMAAGMGTVAGASSK